jgi:hypothetical protein
VRLPQTAEVRLPQTAEVQSPQSVEVRLPRSAEGRFCDCRSCKGWNPGRCIITQAGNGNRIIHSAKPEAALLLKLEATLLLKPEAALLFKPEAALLKPEAALLPNPKNLNTHVQRGAFAQPVACIRQDKTRPAGLLKRMLKKKHYFSLASRRLYSYLESDIKNNIPQRQTRFFNRALCAAEKKKEEPACVAWASTAFSHRPSSWQ